MFWRKYRTKRSFWRLGASLLEEVSYSFETLGFGAVVLSVGGEFLQESRRHAAIGKFSGEKAN